MPRSISEKKLVTGCLKQQASAQRGVYERYAPAMLSLCQRYIADNFEAEEMMINGFLKVYSKISQFKGQGSFEGWIRRIMVNECLNQLRKKRWLHAEIDLENMQDQAQYNTYDIEVDAEELMDIIHQLPYGYRTVFNLYAIEGYSHKEVSEMLGISESTSKSQLSRARNLLQKHLLNTKKKLNNVHYG